MHWANCAPADTTWEQLEEFANTYPDVQLVDELFVREGDMLWTPSWDAPTGVVLVRPKQPHPTEVAKVLANG